MNKLALTTLLAFLMITVVIAFVPEAYAEDPWVLVYDMSGNICDEFNLGDPINITAWCDDIYLPFNITITAPNGTVAYSKTGINTNLWTAIFANMTDAVGDWTVELLGTGGVVSGEGYAAGTYFVIPQVQLGVIATLSACLAGFGVEKLRKRKNKKPQSRRIQ